MKADIPHVEDHVGKLLNVGTQTQGKLTDIAGAAAAAGVFGLSPPENSVTTGVTMWPTFLCHAANVTCGPNLSESLMLG